MSEVPYEFACPSQQIYTTLLLSTFPLATVDSYQRALSENG